MTKPHTPEEWAEVNLSDMSQDGWETVHGMFGLSYASYLVLPRTLLECMPNEWQLRFKALIDELQTEFDTDGEYMVKKRGDNGRFITDPLANYRHTDWDALKAARRPQQPKPAPEELAAVQQVIDALHYP